MTRDGLKFPQPAVINAVLTAEMVLYKLRSEHHATQFHAQPNQKEALLALAHDVTKMSQFHPKSKASITIANL